MKRTKKTIQVTIRFHGDGVVRSTQGGKRIEGGTIIPKLGENVRILICEGDGEGGYRGIDKGSFGIHILGNTRGFRALGEYFLSLAELNTSQDLNYHDHFSEVASFYETKIDIVVRKNPKADFCV